MENAERELNRQLEPFVWLTVLHSISENGRSVREEISIVLAHRTVILQFVAGCLTERLFRGLLSSLLILLLSAFAALIDDHTIHLLLVSKLLLENLLVIAQVIIARVLELVPRLAAIAVTNIVSCVVTCTPFRHLVSILFASIHQLLVIHVLICLLGLMLLLRHSFLKQLLLKIRASFEA